MSTEDHLLNIEQIKEGLLLPVLGRAGGKKNAIIGTHNKCLKVSVQQVPEKGKANDAFIKLLSKLLENQTFTNLSLSRKQIHTQTVSHHRYYKRRIASEGE